MPNSFQENKLTRQCEHLPEKLNEYVFCRICNKRMCVVCAQACGHGGAAKGETASGPK